MTRRSFEVRATCDGFPDPDHPRWRTVAEAESLEEAMRLALTSLRLDRGVQVVPIDNTEE